MPRQKSKCLLIRFDRANEIGYAEVGYIGYIRKEGVCIVEWSPPRRFGRRLKTWRTEAKGYSARQLAAQLKASDSYLLQIESGLKPPPDPQSVIGRTLYAVVPGPTAYEQFLWAMLKIAEVTVRHLALATLQVYRVTADAEVEASATPTLLSNFSPPLACDPTELIDALGGPTQAVDEMLYEKLAMVDAGVVIDWLLQTSFALAFVFEPYTLDEAEPAEEIAAQAALPSAFARPFLRAQLLFPPGEIESVAVPWEG